MLWHWNRMYGRRGLTQHQCVLPNEAGAGAARRFLEVLTARGGASFLCVIKDCGPEGVGMLSFPRPGISIALDIAVREDTPALIDALKRVRREGGRARSTWRRTRSRAPSTSRDGSAHRRVPARAAHLGSERQAAQRAVGAPARRPREGRSSCSGATKGIGRALARPSRGARGRALFCSARPADLARQRA
jgi:hypothetical protein